MATLNGAYPFIGRVTEDARRHNAASERALHSVFRTMNRPFALRSLSPATAGSTLVFGFIFDECLGCYGTSV